MNAEKELIKQIRILREIKPDNDWVISAKARIIGGEWIGQKPGIMQLLFKYSAQYRLALTGVALAVLAGGTIAASQNALPGEPLYGVKKATEKGVAVITGQINTPAANLQLAAKRLEEINQISQRNLVKDLPAAFYEYKTAKAAAKKQVAALIQKDPNNAGAIVKEAGVAMKDISEKEKQIYGVLGLEPNASSSEDGSEVASDRTIVESLINYLDGALLSDQQNSDLGQVKKLYGEGNYSQALDYYLNSSLNN
jgi:hypothetical protein